jgi:hypothetical protein
MWALRERKIKCTWETNLICMLKHLHVRANSHVSFSFHMRICIFIKFLIWAISHCVVFCHYSYNLCRLWVITKNIYDNSWHFRICFQENHTSFNADHNGWIIYEAEDVHTHTSLKADHNGWIIYGAEDVHNNSQIQYICYITGRLVCLFALLIRNYVNLAR